jgi:hypothetical protein
MLIARRKKKLCTFFSICDADNFFFSFQQTSKNILKEQNKKKWRIINSYINVVLRIGTEVPCGQ